MNDVMSKNYVMTFSDGSKWAVPVSTIALNRAERYVAEHNHDLMLSLQEDTLPLFASDASEVADWAKNNMNWSDVKDEAVQLSGPTVNFEQEWIDCSTEVK